MNKFLLGDIYIGNYPITQLFGVNPEIYKRFGLRSHNGLDFACPDNTQIVSCADGWVSEIGNDPSGYGHYVKVIHDGYLTIYAHLKTSPCSVNEKVVVGQLIGLSNNTGNSTGPHLHFGIAPCNDKGIKTEVNNGYAGYINPNGDRCEWKIKNLTEPVKNLSTDTIPVLKSDFEKLVGKADKLDKQDPSYDQLKQMLAECHNQKDGTDKQIEIYQQFIDSLSVQLGTPSKELAAIAGEIEKLIAIEDDIRRISQERDIALQKVDKLEETAKYTVSQLKSQEEALQTQISAFHEQEKIIEEKNKLCEKCLLDLDIIKKERKELAKYSTKELILELFNRFKIGRPK